MRLHNPWPDRYRSQPVHLVNFLIQRRIGRIGTDADVLRNRSKCCVALEKARTRESDSTSFFIMSQLTVFLSGIFTGLLHLSCHKLTIKAKYPAPLDVLFFIKNLKYAFQCTTIVQQTWRAP